MKVRQCVKCDENYSLGDLGYVLVPQADPQVIIFVQQDLLLAGVSDAAGLIPGEKKTNLCQKQLFVYSDCEIQASVLLVDVVLDRQQVVAHGLEGELVQDGRHGVKCPVQDDQL